MKGAALFVAVLLALPASAAEPGTSLSIGVVPLSIGMDKQTVLEKLRTHYFLTGTTPDNQTYFVGEGNTPSVDPVIGGVAFEDGRLSFIQREWLKPNQSSGVDAAKALAAALDSAQTSTGGLPVVVVNRQSVPDYTFTTISYRYPGDRKILFSLTETHGRGSGIGITERVGGQ